MKHLTRLRLPRWYTVILFILVGAAREGVSQQAGNWVKVSPVSILPAGRTGRLYKDMAHYGGTTYRPVSNSILFYDGYMSDAEGFPYEIYANTLRSWDLDSQKVRALTITNTSPLRRHTYEGFTYVDEEDALYMMNVANAGCGIYDMWKYSFATGRWTQISTNVFHSPVKRVNPHIPVTEKN